MHLFLAQFCYIFLAIYPTIIGVKTTRISSNFNNPICIVIAQRGGGGLSPPSTSLAINDILQLSVATSPQWHQKT